MGIAPFQCRERTKIPRRRNEIDNFPCISLLKDPTAGGRGWDKTYAWHLRPIIYGIVVEKPDANETVDGRSDSELLQFHFLSILEYL